MRAFLESILGTYTPVSYSQNIYDSAGTLVDTVDVVPAGLAGVDWTFVITGLCFVVLLWCTLRLLGGIICKIS